MWLVFGSKNVSFWLKYFFYVGFRNSILACPIYTYNEAKRLFKLLI